MGVQDGLDLERNRDLVPSIYRCFCSFCHLNGKARSRLDSLLVQILDRSEDFIVELRVSLAFNAATAASIIPRRVLIQEGSVFTSLQQCRRQEKLSRLVTPVEGRETLALHYIDLPPITRSFEVLRDDEKA